MAIKAFRSIRNAAAQTVVKNPLFDQRFSQEIRGPNANYQLVALLSAVTFSKTLVSKTPRANLPRSNQMQRTGCLAKRAGRIVSTAIWGPPAVNDTISP